MRQSHPQAPAGATRRVQIALVAIMACYLALATAYSFATRLRWGPDEPGHIAYVESLALDLRFPAMGEADVYRPGAAVSHQVQHPPLYYLAAAAVYRAALRLPEDARIRTLRLFSAALGLVSLWLLWRLTGVILSEDRTRLAAVAFLAFLPLFGYMSGVVNNDALVLLLCLAAFRAAAAVMTNRDRMWPPVRAGIFLGLAVLTKEMALALLPVLIAAVVLPRGENGPGLRRRLLQAVILLVPALAIPSVWWIRNAVVFGQPVVYAYVQPPFRNAADIMARPFLAASVAWVWARLSFITLWAPYWAIKGVIPLRPYLAATGPAAALGCLGVVALLTDCARGVARFGRAQAQALVLMLAFAALVAAGVLRYTLLVDYRTVEGGRYMLVAWPYLAILGAAGLAHLSGRFRVAALTTLVVAWLVGDLIVLWGVGRTYGAW